MYELVLPPPQEPEQDEQVTDWAESSLYQYVYRMHYEKMVKRKIITETSTFYTRPQSSDSTRGLNSEQLYARNLK